MSATRDSLRAFLGAHTEADPHALALNRELMREVLMQLQENRTMLERIWERLQPGVPVPGPDPPQRPLLLPADVAAADDHRW